MGGVVFDIGYSLVISNKTNLNTALKGLDNYQLSGRDRGKRSTF